VRGQGELVITLDLEAVGRIQAADVDIGEPARFAEEDVGGAGIGIGVAVCRAPRR
jgi:hypothetical protein